jgi:hypothetical protein
MSLLRHVPEDVWRDVFPPHIFPSKAADRRVKAKEMVGSGAERDCIGYRLESEVVKIHCRCQIPMRGVAKAI